jgi:hypothetical protein
MGPSRGVTGQRHATEVSALQQEDKKDEERMFGNKENDRRHHHGTFGPVFYIQQFTVSTAIPSMKNACFFIAVFHNTFTFPAVFHTAVDFRYISPNQPIRQPSISGARSPKTRCKKSVHGMI